MFYFMSYFVTFSLSDRRARTVRVKMTNGDARKKEVKKCHFMDDVSFE